MGAALCKLFKQRPVNVLFFGLNASGKTALLYRLKLGRVVTTLPTIHALEVFPIVALTLEGVTPALEWLTSQLALKMANKSYLDVWSWMTRTYKAYTLKQGKG